MNNKLVPTCEEFLLENNLQNFDNDLDFLYSYYTERVYEAWYDDAWNGAKKFVDKQIGGTLNDVADWTVKKALPTVVEYAAKGIDAIGQEGRKVLAATGQWCIENNEAIFLALDIIDYAGDILLIAGLATGGAGSAAGMGVKALIKGGKTMLKTAAKKEFKKIAKDKAETAAKETVEKVAKETIEKVGKETAEKVGKETAEKVGKETAEKVGKETAEKVGKEAAEKAAKKAARKKLKNRIKIVARWVRRKITKLFDMIKRIMNVIKDIIALLKSLFGGNKKNELTNCGYDDINTLRKNLYSNRYTFDSVPKSVPDTFLRKWTEEGLEDDNRKDIENIITAYQSKCLENKVNREIVRVLITIIMNGVDESYGEYLSSYAETGNEISTKNEDVKTGETESYTEAMNLIGALADETTGAYEDMTDYIERFLIQYGFEKNNGGSSFVNNKTKIVIKLKPLSVLFFSILHQFVVSVKD